MCKRYMGFLRLCPISSSGVFDTTRFNSGHFTLNNGVVTVNAAMTAQVTYRVTTDTVNGPVARTQTTVYIDQTAGSRSYMYNRTNYGEATGTATAIKSYSPGDVIRVLCSQSGGTSNTMRCVGNACGLTVVAL